MKEPTKKEIYDSIAHQIEREDSLVNNRINWFLVSQGFFFAAAGLIIDSELEKCWKIFATRGIAGIGIIMGVGVLFGVAGAEISLSRIKDHWKRIENEYAAYFPPPYGKGCASKFGCVPRFLIPLVLVVAWAVFLSKLDSLF